MNRALTMIATTVLAGCSTEGGSGQIDQQTNEPWNICDPSVRAPAWEEGVTACSSDADCGTRQVGDACRGFCITGTPPGPTGFCFTGTSLGIRAAGRGCMLQGDCVESDLSCCTQGNLLDSKNASLFGGTTQLHMCALPGIYSVGGTCGIDTECACAPW